MESKSIEKAIMLTWLWFTIIFFNSWEILFLPSVLIALDCLFETEPKMKTQAEDSGEKATRIAIHEESLNQLIRSLIEEEKKKNQEKKKSKNS
ncbi:hypothetical protein NPIL_56961 [Nephila pilipes]|uniref:Uncharacterized protein n=1 Tax=Nephila pilipes TaxID=299642 RepID=A0A8X6MYA5_NEPPI|nr:hypothetical protein NPIL_56961 [Nephila pilipes]